MEKKKSLKANLEKTKTLFLSIGLIISISLVVSAFSWKSESIVKIFTGDPLPVPVDFTPITKPKPEPPKKKETKTNIVKSFISDVINVTDDSTDVGDIDIDWDLIFVDDDPIIEGDEPIIPTLGNGAVFPGGLKALQRFVGNNVDYPAVARENGIQGTVYLRFEVTKKGTVGRIEVLNPGIDNLLQEASLDVIKKLPKFKPGMHKGAKVNVWFSIPISFKLNIN